MADIAPPMPLSIIVCDRVIMDAITGMPSIIGITQVISATKYPARHSRLTVFSEFTNIHHNVKITTRLVDVQKEDEVLFEKEDIVLADDVKTVACLIFTMEGFIFPHPGEYRIQMSCGTEPLGERRIICREVKPGGGDKKNES